MTAPKIRMLVAEDSAYMLMAIRTMVKLDPRIEIVGEARDGIQAVEMARALRPDIVTMDVNMPALDGITATRRIMAETPTVVIMLSSMTEEGLAITDDALAAGAVDHMPKSLSAVDVDIATIATGFAQKIALWGASARTVRLGPASLPPIPPATDLLVIAGGYGSTLVAGALLQALPALPCPVLVALDEIPASQTLSAVRYFSTLTGRTAQEGRHRSVLAPGSLTVLPGGRKSALKGAGGFLTLDLRTADPDSDILASAVAAVRHPAVALLSGAARPLDGLAAGRDRLAALFVQDPATCADPALPGAALAAGLSPSFLTFPFDMRRSRAA